MKNVMSKLKIDPIFIDSVLAKDLESTPKEEFVKRGIITSDAKIKMSELACALSHIKTLMHFVDENTKNCLILEDDIDSNFNLETLKNKLSDIFEHLKGSYQFLNFGRCFGNCCFDRKISDNLAECIKPFCLHAYSVSSEYAKLILKEIFPLSKPLDYEILNLKKRYRTRFYCSTPWLFVQKREEVPSTLRDGQTDLPECIC
ncbi:hypothetical protein MHBO_000881 [Bonamia ostreae]|uniref:Glycosyl transferase family 25 domain-containing protein n=1 Tax=Bonamia ostreae TaxID=126728 RepID=A0ABV2AH50_9EUKA